MKYLFDKYILLRYLVSGSSAAVVNIGLLYLFTDILGIWYLTSGILAFIIAFVVSFLLQKFWTFQDGDKDKIYQQSFKYFGVQAFNLILNTGLLYTFVDIFGLWHIFAQIIASGLIAIESFIVYKFLIFNKKPETDEE